MVQLVFLSPLMEWWTGFGHATALQMMQRMLTYYGAIDNIDLKGNGMNIMRS